RSKKTDAGQKEPQRNEKDDRQQCLNNVHKRADIESSKLPKESKLTQKGEPPSIFSCSGSVQRRPSLNVSHGVCDTVGCVFENYFIAALNSARRSALSAKSSSTGSRISMPVILSPCWTALTTS